MVHGECAGLVWQIWLYWSQVSVTMKQTLKLILGDLCVGSGGRLHQAHLISLGTGVPLFSVLRDGLRHEEGNLTKSCHLSMDMALSPKLDFFRLGIY